MPPRPASDGRSDRESRASPQRRRRALALASVLVALPLVALAALAATDLGFLRHHIEGAAAKAIGQPVHVEGAIRLDPFAGPSLALDRVRIGDAEQPRLQAARVSLEPRLTDLLRGTVTVAAVRMHGAVIRLRDAGGAALSAAGTNGGGSASPLPAVTLTDAELHYRDAATGISLQADGCQLVLPRLALDGGADAPVLSRLRLDGELACARVRRGALTLSDLQVALQAGDGRLAAGPMSAEILDGALEGELQADFTGDVPHLEVTYRLQGFALQAFLRGLASEASAGGRLDLEVALTARGRNRASLARTLEGSARLSGEGLRVEGVDLDARIAEYRSTQRFNLVDVGAFLFAGPAGLAVTKGYNYTRLLQGGGGTTRIATLLSAWRIANGVARAEDVALATARNRLVAQGALDIPEQRFRDFRVLLVDGRGCAVMEQAITGTFSDPGIAETSMVASLLGPLTSLVERGLEALTPQDCEPVYTGSVSHP